MRAALVFSLFFSLLAADEPSALGAGNLDSANPYGLTSAEKNILKNKQTLKDLKSKSYTNQVQVNSLLERIDGLQSIIEGLTQKSQANEFELKRIQQSLSEDKTSEKMTDLETRVTQLEAMIKVNEENLTQLKSAMEKLSQLIDSINSTYVTKDEYNALVTDINDFKKLVAKELKSGSNVKTSSNDNKKISNGTLATMAAENYKKKYYTKAIEQYEELIDRKYKPAYAHYMIGEMLYYRKDYGKAIAYFKESVKRYDKASYMPTLMLHTAISMKKTGDKKNADSFFNAIIVKYPDSKAASIAKKELK